MNINDIIIKNHTEFESLKMVANQIFLDGLRLPNQVFHPQFDSFQFISFDQGMSAEFWQTIQQLALASEDTHIIMAVMKPDPVSYYRKEFGYYNWFKLPIHLSIDDYWHLLTLEPEHSPADAVLWNTYVIAWMSPSKQWAIWGEREQGVCVLGTANTFEWSDSNWHPVEEALQTLISQEYVHQKVPDKIIEAFKLHYF